MRVPAQAPRFARRAGGVAALGLAGVGALLAGKIKVVMTASSSE